MKGKVKSLKFAIVSTCCALISVFCVMGIANHTKTYSASANPAVVTSGGDLYSQADENDVILSVEKIAIESKFGNSGNVDDLYNYKAASAGEGSTKQHFMPFASHTEADDKDDEYYAYYDIPNDVSVASKTVVANEGFVVLNNSKDVNGGEVRYANANLKTKLGVDTNVAEAVMLTFGGYYYDENEEVQIAGEKVGAGIVSINPISITRDGIPVQLNNFNAREYIDNEGRHFKDFTYIIPQIQGNEGEYQVSITYYYMEYTRVQTFAFNIVFASTYNSVVEDNGNVYSALPSISTPIATQDGVYRYFLGETNKYPTLSYNYELYTLDYNVILNGRNTAYSYRKVGNEIVCQITNSTETKTKTYTLTGSSEIAVLVFSDPGTYTFKFNLMYKGQYNEKLDKAYHVNDKSLVIYGNEVVYTKDNYKSAKMTYVELASNSTVSVIVPNAYIQGSKPTDETNLGIAYKLVSDTSVVGSVITRRSADVTQKYENVNDINVYEKTNQGSVKFVINNAIEKNSSDAVLDKCYYYYSSSYKANMTELTKSPFNNETFFDKPGYYVVVVTYSTGLTGAHNIKEQRFAFRYVNETPTLNIKNSKDQSFDVFTNDKVTISWKPADVFERDIEVYYHYYKNQKVTRDYLIANTPEIRLLDNRGETVGQNVAKGEFACFVAVLKVAGKVVGEHYFIIDKQDITGVAAYVVEYRGYYRFANDRQTGNLIKIDAVTDQMVAMDWNNKPSGATVGAKYWYAPFNKETNNVSVISTTGFTNGYEMGGVGGCQTFSKPNNENINFSNVFQESGIYLVELTDIAGNSCSYMIVVDDTENYFKVTYQNQTENAFMTATSTLVSEDIVNIEVGENKYIKLFANDTTENNQIITTIKNILNLGNGDNYFKGVGNNIVAIRNMFANIASANTTYLKVANVNVASYNTSYVEDVSLGFKITNSKKSVVMNFNNIAEEDEISVVRYFYLKGENQTGLTNITNSKNWVIVEINKDRSLVLMYHTNYEYSTRQERENFGKIERTYTNNKIDYGGNASNDNYIYVTWFTGSGEFEVDKIEYNFYTLTNSYNNNDFFYYNLEPAKTDVLYQKEVNVSNVFDGYGWTSINLDLTSNKTQEGLYVVTRTYCNEVSDKVRNYYFIVDRNNLIYQIDESNVVGKYVSIGLFDDEYTGFSGLKLIESNIKDKEFDLDFDGVCETKFSTAFTTGKVPATLQIPTAKYFDGTIRSLYYSGKTIMSLYFKGKHDVYNINDEMLKLFEIELSDLNKINKNYYTIDVSQLIDSTMYKYFVNSTNKTEWLCLPGTYLIVLQDTVKTTGDRNETIFAFEIKAENPTVDLYSVVDKNSSYAFAGHIADVDTYTLTTNEEFIKLELPTYSIESTKAQIDINYLLVYNKTESKYLFNSNTTNMAIDSDIVTNNADGSRTIVLPTGLRDINGDVRKEALNTNLEYLIEIRYVLDKISTVDKHGYYTNCYYYYQNGDLIKYYTATYKVVIDRTAPNKNVTALMQNGDILLEYYSEESERENAVYGTTQLYFVNQYKKYYQTGDIKDLFAYQVKPTDIFQTESDLATVYYRVLNESDSWELSLPVLNFATNYRTANNIQHNPYYSTMLTGDVANKFIEIVEVDKAGNQTQYLVYYLTADNDAQLEINIKAKKSVAGSVSIYYEDVTIEENNNLTVFDFDLPTTLPPFVNYSKQFYIINITNAVTHSVYTFKTNKTTNFVENNSDGLIYEIVNILKESGQGNYKIQIISRTNNRDKNVYSVDFNYYTKEIKLDVTKLIRKNANGYYYIDLQGANLVENNIVYYAEIIEVTFGNITNIYTCDISNNFTYYDISNNYFTILELIEAEKQGSYIVKMTDCFGNISTTRFNTQGKQPYEFKDKDEKFYSWNAIYYGATVAEVNYDVALYNVAISYNYNVGESHEGKLTTAGVVKYGAIDVKAIELTAGGCIKIYPYFEMPTGGVIDVVITFTEIGSVATLVEETPYHIVLDTRTGAVNLRNNNNLAYDLKYTPETIPTEAQVPSSATSGNMYLSWKTTSNDYFVYRYTLFETTGFVDGESILKTLDLTEATNHIISTMPGDLGLYYFEVAIYTKNGIFLNNKVYSFIVKATLNSLYYIQVGAEEIKPNASFNFEELGIGLGELSYLQTQDSQILTVPKTQIPLYITNKILDEEFVVVVADGLGANSKYYEYETYIQNKVFLRIYRVYTSTYSLYFGVFYIEDTDNIVNNFKLVKNNLDDSENLENDDVDLNTDAKLYYTESGESVDKFTLEFNYNTDVYVGQKFDALLKKNIVKVSIYYNNEFVADEVPNIQYLDNDSKVKFSYEILGSGLYSFVFTDLAGNVHKFTSLYDEQEKLELSILREVVVTVNDVAPINRGFYNGDVKISVADPSIYDLGSLSLVSAKCNGEAYTPTNTQYSYNFSKIGRYEVVFKAKYNGQELKKTLVFTIVNPNEAVEYQDLTSVANYSITKVENSFGMDVTDVFLNIMEKEGKLISYKKIMEYSYELEIASGKQSFKVTYLVNDGIYPARSVEFEFTMNNEIPNLECDLAGDSTTKGFTFYYNPGVIFEQVGDSYIIINGTIVATINSESADRKMEYSITEKENGAGVYNVTVEGTSGIRWTGFKVTIKEPLNTWAIIIIVVVTIAVATVVVTIIVLRRKMRIR